MAKHILKTTMNRSINFIKKNPKFNNNQENERYLPENKITI